VVLGMALRANGAYSIRRTVIRLDVRDAYIM